MSGRKRNLIIGAVSLLIGVVSYVLFREGSYIGERFDFVPYLQELRDLVSPLSNNFTRGYIQDFAWCLSLACGLHIVLRPANKQVLCCGGVAFCCGVIWECLQYVSLIAGTADFLDVLIYFAASNVYIVINIKE